MHVVGLVQIVMILYFYFPVQDASEAVELSVPRESSNLIIS